METIFKLGDKVFDIGYGWGVVTKTEGISPKYPIYVKYDTGEVSYTFDGKELEVAYSSTLSFTEYTLEGFSQERPEELPKIGDIVWVKDADDTDWYIGYFKGMVGNRFNCNTSKTGSYDVTWDQMTTKDPHADGK
jgi:hypothetical protein